MATPFGLVSYVPGLDGGARLSRRVVETGALPPVTARLDAVKSAFAPWAASRRYLNLTETPGHAKGRPAHGDRPRADGPGQILVTGTVKDLVLGSGLEFARPGTATLKRPGHLAALRLQRRVSATSARPPNPACRPAAWRSSASGRRIQANNKYGIRTRANAIMPQSANYNIIGHSRSIES